MHRAHALQRLALVQIYYQLPVNSYSGTDLSSKVIAVESHLSSPLYSELPFSQLRRTYSGDWLHALPISYCG